MDYTNPPLPVLIALGSAIVHAEEYMSADSHHYDRSAFETALLTPGVKEWLDAMRKAQFLPRKRSEDGK